MKKLLAILLVAVALPGLLTAEQITLFDPESDE